MILNYPLSIRQKLAQAYQIFAHLGLDDHTYTHLSARAEDGESFYIHPFGLCFNEVTAENLLRVTLKGKVLEGSEAHYNQTGYIIHGQLYQTRRDLNAAFHMHTPATIAVSVLEEGLLPLSQWALHFYERIAYSDYHSLALTPDEGSQIAQSLGEHSVLLMRHHGALMCGKTIEEAMFYTHHLELACQAQVQALSMNRPIKHIPEEICRQTVQDLIGFEAHLGERDWKAWVRQIHNKLSRSLAA